LFGIQNDVFGAAHHHSDQAQSLVERGTSRSAVESVGVAEKAIQCIRARVPHAPAQVDLERQAAAGVHGHERRACRERGGGATDRRGSERRGYSAIEPQPGVIQPSGARRRIVPLRHHLDDGQRRHGIAPKPLLVGVVVAGNDRDLVERQEARTVAGGEHQIPVDEHARAERGGGLLRETLALAHPLRVAEAVGAREPAARFLEERARRERDHGGGRALADRVRSLEHLDPIVVSIDDLGAGGARRLRFRRRGAAQHEKERGHEPAAAGDTYRRERASTPRLRAESAHCLERKMRLSSPMSHTRR
jgi:hypothetical protein